MTNFALEGVMNITKIKNTPASMTLEIGQFIFLEFGIYRITGVNAPHKSAI